MIDFLIYCLRSYLCFNIGHGEYQWHYIRNIKMYCRIYFGKERDLKSCQNSTCFASRIDHADLGKVIITHFPVKEIAGFIRRQVKDRYQQANCVHWHPRASSGLITLRKKNVRWMTWLPPTKKMLWNIRSNFIMKKVIRET